MGIQAVSGSVPAYADRYENLALTRDDVATAQEAKLLAAARLDLQGG